MNNNTAKNLTMIMDLYELTMSNGIFNSDRRNEITYFDMFFRRVPDDGGYAIMAGIEQLIEYMNNLEFSDDDIAYLRGLKLFSDDFINKAKEILSYDTNFMQIYDNTKNGVMAFFNSNSSQETNNTNENENQNDNNDVNQNSLTNNLESESNNQNIGGSNENEQTANQSKENENTSTSEAKPLSEEEQMILNVKNTTSFIKPIEGTITSGYGQREVSKATIPKNHTGTDIAANLGTKIKAATDGEVVIASSEGDYGNHLKIQIGEVSVVYAHCNSLYVKQGDKVVQGQEIAEVGSTGNSTGPHLHFEIRFLEKTIDPQKILDL